VLVAGVSHHTLVSHYAGQLLLIASKHQQLSGCSQNDKVFLAPFLAPRTGSVSMAVACCSCACTTKPQTSQGLSRRRSTAKQ
jgi:hypothetical protein